jgi:hypothetical protein
VHLTKHTTKKAGRHTSLNNDAKTKVLTHRVRGVKTISEACDMNSRRGPFTSPMGLGGSLLPGLWSKLRIEIHLPNPTGSPQGSFTLPSQRR